VRSGLRVLLRSLLCEMMRVEVVGVMMVEVVDWPRAVVEARIRTPWLKARWALVGIFGT
jgi:hypothetical protein